MGRRFFFSSRRRHTRLQGDWSSDVCSSDLLLMVQSLPVIQPDSHPLLGRKPAWLKVRAPGGPNYMRLRSEERRVGKSVDLGGRRIIKKKKRRMLRTWRYSTNK